MLALGLTSKERITVSASHDESLLKNEQNMDFKELRFIMLHRLFSI
ncbi:hypothetical protein OIU79_030762 [Salix purpurea]|uniref:Uncharacterized protein n=1 Tax=Salix purpurea TaxID=77065 RepID=A0A9Q0ZRX5_SALPP|nr:hypothetical protein OIU79_030762 [Salix purpurea]